MRRYILLVVLFGIFGTATAYVHQPAAPVAVPVMMTENHILIIDAGHGGMDGGTSSAEGILESDLNLQIAQKCYEQCLFLGENACLTRTGEAALCDADAVTIREKKVSDTQNRVKLINSYPNATLLSIHQNALPGYPHVHGAQVFYNTVPYANQFAQTMQNTLNGTINTGNEKKSKQIPSSVYLMKHANCPAVLVECGFLSNGTEAALLQQPDYQTKLAAAIISGYLSYKGTMSYEGKNGLFLHGMWQ